MATKFEILVSAQLDKTSASNIQRQLNEIAKNANFNVGATSANNMSKALNNLHNSASTAASSTQTLNDTVNKFSEWAFGAEVVYLLRDAIGSMVDQVIDLDDALVEFNKVTDLTDDQLDRFVNKAYDVADSLARTGVEAIEAATAFSKAGYKEQAADLAEVALLYQNIADGSVSVADATNLIVSQMKAFNIEAEDSITIIDQINEVKCEPHAIAIWC